MSRRTSRATLHRAPAAALLALALTACGATPNRGSTADGPRSAGSAGATRAPALDPGPGAAASRTQGTEAGETADAAATERESAGGGIVAFVAGQPVYASELLAQWMHRDASGLRGHLESLVFSRLIVAEARRLAIELDAAMVEARYQEGLDRLQEELEAQEPGLTIDRYVREQLRLDPERYRADLQRDLRLDLLAERCVRAFVLGCERAEVRVLVVDSREDLETVEAALAAGGDFGELAREHSTHESKEALGRIPPVVRSESGLARLAFATAVGQVGGPIFEEESYLLLEVTGRPEPLLGDWTALGPAVEASLLAEPIQDPEYWQWKRAMQDTYEVDLTPLRELLDAAHSGLNGSGRTD